jgi:hypothetical protein
MDAPHTAPSTSEFASEAGGLLAGLGIITMTLFPFALPGLVLALLLVLPALPLALVALVVWLLARLLLLPLRLVRTRLRRSPGSGADSLSEAHPHGRPASARTNVAASAGH